MNINIERLEIVARGLGSLRNQVVFVGGATASLYIDAKGAPEFRPTDDIDCIIEVTSKLKFNELSEQLRSYGFINDSRPGAPICRWVYKNITVDVMPLATDILGFSNRWYVDGYKTHDTYELPSGVKIYILSLAYFIATKLEAFNSRGQNDCRVSSDIEDILLVLDGCKRWEESISKADNVLRDYLRDQFKYLLERSDFKEAAYGCMPTYESERAGRLLERIRSASF